MKSLRTSLLLAALALSLSFTTDAVAQKTRDVTVHGKAVNGSSFRNNSHNFTTIDSTASSDWNKPEKWYRYNANGSGEAGDNSYRPPDVFLRRLIVGWGNGRFESVGRRRAITLRPGETVHSALNDAKYCRITTNSWGCTDNKGYLNIDWFVR